MARWKENPVVGIVAGAVLAIAVGFAVARMFARPPALSPEVAARMPAIPASTPYAK